MITKKNQAHLLHDVTKFAKKERVPKRCLNSSFGGLDVIVSQRADFLISIERGDFTSINRLSKLEYCLLLRHTESKPRTAEE